MNVINGFYFQKCRGYEAVNKFIKLQSVSSTEVASPSEDLSKPSKLKKQKQKKRGKVSQHYAPPPWIDGERSESSATHSDMSPTTPSGDGEAALEIRKAASRNKSKDAVPPLIETKKKSRKEKMPRKSVAEFAEEVDKRFAEDDSYQVGILKSSVRDSYFW